MNRPTLVVAIIALCLSLVGNLLLLTVIYRVNRAEKNLNKTLDGMVQLADIVEGQQQLLKTRDDLLNYR